MMIGMNLMINIHIEQDDDKNIPIDQEESEYIPIDQDSFHSVDSDIDTNPLQVRK